MVRRSILATCRLGSTGCGHGEGCHCHPTIRSRWDSAGKRAHLSVRPSRAPSSGSRPALIGPWSREARPQLGFCVAHENVLAVCTGRGEEGMARSPATSLSCCRARGLGQAQEQLRVPHRSEAPEPIHSPKRTVPLCPSYSLARRGLGEQHIQGAAVAEPHTRAGGPRWPGLPHPAPTGSSPPTHFLRPL